MQEVFSVSHIHPAQFLAGFFTSEVPSALTQYGVIVFITLCPCICMPCLTILSKKTNKQKTTKEPVKRKLLFSVRRGTKKWLTDRFKKMAKTALLTLSNLDI